MQTARGRERLRKALKRGDRDVAITALAERAPTVTSVTADARDFDLSAKFPLVIAPMQLVQVIGGRPGRLAMLERVHAHLEQGGLFAAALAEPRDESLVKLDQVQAVAGLYSPDNPARDRPGSGAERTVPSRARPAPPARGRYPAWQLLPVPSHHHRPH